MPARVKVFLEFLTEQVNALGEFPDRTWAESIYTPLD